MATVYDARSGEALSAGLQGCTMSDQALHVARRWAEKRGEVVHLEDDDGNWLVYPDGSCKGVHLEDEDDDWLDCPRSCEEAQS